LENRVYVDPKILEDKWFAELTEVMGDSLPVYLCGRPSDLREVAGRQVRERGRYTYMADLVRDDEGQIARICFDRIACGKAGKQYS